MSTLHTVRKFAMVAALATGALIASASHADETVHLGSMVVTAQRVSVAEAPMIGAITVTARRPADTRVADLGGITVSARRIGSVSVATTESTNHSWQ